MDDNSTLNTDMMKRIETGADRVKQRTHRNKKVQEETSLPRKKRLLSLFISKLKHYLTFVVVVVRKITL